MDPRLKKQQAQSESQLHTIDVEKALANAKGAARKLNPKPVHDTIVDIHPPHHEPTEEPKRSSSQEKDLALPLGSRTIPMLVAFTVIVAIATYVLVSRFAH